MKKEIAGFPGYFIDEYGNIESHWKLIDGGHNKWHTAQYIISDTWSRLLKHDVDKRGRHRVRLRCATLKYKKRFVCVLILQTFIGPCPPKMECCHNDGNCSNNVLSNLRWDTKSNNMKDKIIHGTHKYGQLSGCAKLTDKDIIEIRQRALNKETFASIAQDYNVTPQNIFHIHKRNTWTHL